MDSHPKYAIIRLRQGDDVFNLFRLLVENGYPEVSFVNGLRENMLLQGGGGGINSGRSHYGSSTQRTCGDTSSSQNESNSEPSDGKGTSNDKKSAKFSKDRREHQMTSGGRTDLAVQPDPTTAASTLLSTLATTMSTANALFSTPTIATAAMMPQFNCLTTNPTGAPLSTADAVTSFSSYAFGGGADGTGVNLPTTLASLTNTDLQNLVCSQIAPLTVNATNVGNVVATGSGNNDPRRIPTAPIQSSATVGRLLTATNNTVIIGNGGPSPVNERSSPPPSPSMNGNGSNTTAQLRQRGSRSHNEDPSVYASCRLCHNKIMASRLSNLTNHVRRHAVLKQFQCCYCEYTHNEMAKVRLHMLHNHKDKDSQPIDNLSPEMQAQWDILMEQCFPEYNRETFSKGDNNTRNVSQVVAASAFSSNANRNSGSSSNNNNNQTVTASMSVTNENSCSVSLSSSRQHKRTATVATRGESPEMKKARISTSRSPERHSGKKPETQFVNAAAALYTCVECGEMSQEGEQMEEHLQQAHPQDCLVFFCSYCTYQNTDQWKVRLHVNLKHTEVPEDDIEMNQGAAKLSELVPRFFPDVAKRANADTPVKAEVLEQDENGEMDVVDASPIAVSDSSTKDTISETHVGALDGENSISESRDPVSMEKENGTSNHSVQSADSSMEKQATSSEPSLTDQMQNEEVSENVRCELCKKTFDGQHSLTVLLQHAKKHYHIKQFQCRNCSYCSSDATHVQKHMLVRHPQSNITRPINNKSVILESSWMQVMARCFPSIAPRLSKFRFKSFEYMQRQQRKNNGSPPAGDKATCSDGSSGETDTRPPEGAFGFQSCDLPLQRSQCRLCAKLVMDEEREAHAASHVPTAKPFGCSLCQFRTSDYRHLRAHLLKHKLKTGVKGVAEKARQSNDAGEKQQYFKFCFGE